MLFNSAVFLFAFLPLTVVVYQLLLRWADSDWAKAWLVAASLFFYAWWKPVYLVLILFSIGFNFAVGRLLSREGSWRTRGTLVFGVATNLLLLGYFKYANFFVDNVNTALGTHWEVGDIFFSG